MKLDYTSLSHRLGKFALAAVLGVGAGAGTLSSTPAQAQMPKIIVQCVAPLVPNADGTDCVRPAPQAKTCHAPTILDNGRCIEPTRYIRFSNCTGPAGKNFHLGYYSNNRVVLFRSGNPGSPITPTQAQTLLAVAKDHGRGAVHCQSVR
jgi:hypothetical protein